MLFKLGITETVTNRRQYLIEVEGETSKEEVEKLIERASNDNEFADDFIDGIYFELIKNKIKMKVIESIEGPEKGTIELDDFFVTTCKTLDEAQAMNDEN